MNKLFKMLILLVVSAVLVSAQETVPKLDESCEGPVHKNSDVSRKVRLGYRPTPNLTAEALAHSVRGQVILTAVFCKSGRVTDIKVVEGLPYGVTEQATEAARNTQFTPAEKDGQNVSQATKFIFKFGYIGEQRALAQGQLNGRIIESIELSSYGESQSDKVWNLLKTRAGEPYDQKLIDRDWHTLLISGDFDRDNSTIRIEEGDRGGVVVVFDLKERVRN